jgi:hypothetical protein
MQELRHYPHQASRLVFEFSLSGRESVADEVKEALHCRDLCCCCVPFTYVCPDLAPVRESAQ